MHWPYLIISAVGGLCLAALLCFELIRRLGRREPYASFLRLRHRRKLTFFRLLMQDKRVPWFVKVLPVVAIVYVVSPIDLLPGIVLDDLALALLVLVLIIRFTPRQVLAELLEQAAVVGPVPTASSPPKTSDDGSG